jgi:hypothetical protein
MMPPEQSFLIFIGFDVHSEKNPEDDPAGAGMATFLRWCLLFAGRLTAEGFIYDCYRDI